MNTDDIWKRDEADSPCVKICVVHPEARLCIGCHRSIDEIAGWSRFDAETRAKINADLPARSELLKGKRRGGRRGRG